mmetsp:Transcript_30894/g.51044  ORF Transcript_30894/g.51044 Transcript_30894/m.51044 type:complete len:217 (+) Transcript_30894:1293-1943(+)
MLLLVLHNDTSCSREKGLEIFIGAKRQGVSSPIVPHDGRWSSVEGIILDSGQVPHASYKGSVEKAVSSQQVFDFQLAVHRKGTLVGVVTVSRIKLGVKGFCQTEDSPQVLWHGKQGSPIFRERRCEKIVYLWWFQKGHAVGHQVTTEHHNGRLAKHVLTNETLSKWNNHCCCGLAGSSLSTGSRSHGVFVVRLQDGTTLHLTSRRHLNLGTHQLAR